MAQGSETKSRDQVLGKDYVWRPIRFPPPVPLICVILREVLDTFWLRELEAQHLPPGLRPTPDLVRPPGDLPLRPVNPSVPSCGKV